MKKLSLLLMAVLISFIGFVTVGCDDDDKGTTPDPENNASVQFDFSASQQVLESMSVTKVVVKLEKSGYSDSLLLIVEKTVGEFSKLEPGDYTVTVTAYEGTTVVATGSSQVTVEAGKVTNSAIILKLTQGGVEVVIEWDDLEINAPKYIFFFIGDGMAWPQINATEAAMGVNGFYTMNETPMIGDLNLQDFPIVGTATTHAQDRYITGSAAAGTALACGEKTTINTIAKNGTHTMDLKTMAEMARDKGMKVGIVSSVSIDHATPAAFYAHTNHRGNYEDIDNYLVRSGFDYFAGGNVRHNKYGDPLVDASLREIADLNDFIAYAADSNYTYVNTKAAFDALTPASGKVIATLKKLETFTSDGCAMPYQIDLPFQESDDDKITLADFTEKGIELLDNENGFFMMVEGGKVDWACHANDAVSAIYDMVIFDEAIGKAVSFYNQHPDETLIIVTGDHECGGLTEGFATTEKQTWFATLKHQSLSYIEFASKVSAWRTAGDVTFDMALDSAQHYFGLNSAAHEQLALNKLDSTRLEDAFNLSMDVMHNDKTTRHEEETYEKYGYYYYDAFTITVTHLLNRKAGLAWTSYYHTAVPVPVFAMGKGADKFNGYYDNTDIAKKIIEIGQLD